MLEKQFKQAKKAAMAEMKQAVKKVLFEFENMLDSIEFNATQPITRKTRGKKVVKNKRLGRPKKLVA